MELEIDLTLDDEPPPPPKIKKPTKAEKKAAKKLEKELREKQLRRDHLERELKYTELNWKTLKWKYMKMLREMKVPQMRMDAVKVWHVFERTIDTKNFAISRLLDFLDETEIQYRTNLNKHLELIDDLIDFYIKRLDEMGRNYDQEQTTMHTGAGSLQYKMKQQQNTAEEHIQGIMISMEQKFQQYMTIFTGESLAKIEDDRNKAIEELQNLRVELERQIEALWYQLKGVLTDYQNTTKEMREEYEFLKVQDIALTYELQRQVTRTLHLNDTIKSLKDRLASVREHKSMMLSHIMEEKRYFLDTFITLRSRLKNERIHDKNQLTTLTVESNESMKWLQNLVTKGESILKMAELCRKMETQQEKICPYPNRTEIQEEVSDEDEDEICVPEPSNDALHKIFNEYEDLELFWQRVGQADLKRIEIEQCYDLLTMENTYLVHGLQHYFEGLPPIPVPDVLKDNVYDDKDPCKKRYQ